MQYQWHSDIIPRQKSESFPHLSDDTQLQIPIFCSDILLRFLPQAKYISIAGGGRFILDITLWYYLEEWPWFCEGDERRIDEDFIGGKRCGVGTDG